ncbi:uncharacterized protein LOC125232838 [Leguminivora glycinivorella]|uniref:uncharacterized protein LOC125232838 n=1 Tax=Leguminivora glycinivorella TaxID=1035111 RepID=UPI00200BC6B8|nr:uncharacterized protein LOC125232838 [Leguminivora glycinivorella]
MRLDILLIFLLNTGWIYYGHAADVSPGGQQVQNPKDPKYQKMAAELVHSYLQLKNTKNVTVNKVTTQVVEGLTTRIQLKVVLVNGKSSLCNCTVYEKNSEKLKFVTFKCDSFFTNKLLSSTVNSRPGQDRDPKNPKYKKLANFAIGSFFNQPGKKPFKKEDVKTISVSKAKVKINSKIMTVLTIDVMTIKNVRFKCKGVVVETPWETIEATKVTDIDCDINKGETPEDTQLPESQSPQAENPDETQLTDSEPPKEESLDETQLPKQGQSQDEDETAAIVAPSNKIKTGGEQLQNPSSSKYLHLAEESFKRYTQKHHHRPLSADYFVVTKVTTQVVAGLITRLDFKAVIKIGHSLQCHSEIFEPPGQNSRDIKVNCLDIPGGEISENPSNPEYKQLAKESFEKYLTSRNIRKFKVKELRVTRVTTQVVSGVIYRINFKAIPTKGNPLECNSEIFDQPWRHYKNIEVKCIPPRSAIKLSASSGMLDGKTKQNPSDPKYKRLAKESFKKYVTSHNIRNFIVKELRVSQVTTQEVSGVLYQVDFKAIPTKGNALVCHSEILDQPWRKYKNIVVKCIPTLSATKLSASSDSALDGGEMEQNPSDPEFKRLAEESFKKYKTSNKLKFIVKELRVTKATSQVVSGIIFRIDFMAIPTKGVGLLCHSEILDQPWLNNKNIDVTCMSPSNTKLSASSMKAGADLLSASSGMPGGQTEQDPSDPEYKRLAEESFKKYKMTNRYIGNFIVKEIRVTKVTTQVVSGVLYRIDFMAIPTKGIGALCHSEILDQPWLNNKNIDVTCMSPSNTKLSASSMKVGANLLSANSGMPGGQNQQNPSDSKYNRLAKESFKKYLTSHNIRNFKVKELRVSKVTTQVVSGVIYRLDFKAIPTKGNALECHSEVLDQPWRNYKNIVVKCTPPLSATKLSASSDSALDGGEMDQNPSDPEFERLAEESFKKYKTSNKLKFIVKELRVTKATTQVVSGVIFRIDFMAIPTKGVGLLCHSEILDQPWLNNKNIDVTCMSPSNTKLSASSMKARADLLSASSGMPGGQTEQDPSDPEYKRLAEESFKKYKMTNRYIGNFIVKEIRVTKVTTQVVSGVLYRIDFMAIPTKGVGALCHSDILDQPWLNNKNIDVTCMSPSNTKLSASSMKIGGEKNQDPSDAQYKRLAKVSFKKYVTSHNIRNFIVKELRVSKVTTQEVSGVLYRIDFMAIPTKGVGLLCHSEIWDQPWLNNKNIEVRCKSQSKSKLSASSMKIGGEKNKDPSDAQYKRLAKESFKKYLTSHNIRKFIVKELRVSKVTTQEVSGVLYRIDFMAIPTKGVGLLCHSEIWDQPWLNNKNIEVRCKSQSKSKLSASSMKIGGEKNQDPSDAQYKRLAKESFKKYLTSHNIRNFIMKELRVSKVTTQEVSGVLYRIDFMAIPTKGVGLLCHSEIWDQPWLNNKNIEVRCKSQSKSKLSASSMKIGGEKNQDPSDAQYKRLAKESFKKYLTSHNIRNFVVKELRVSKVTTQEVSGVIYRIDFQAIPTKGNALVCHSEILDQAWRNYKNIVVKCIPPLSATY